jgi:2OG-Fe(II) oxygenase superfamily
MRGFATPALAPIDKLRLELDEQFDEGASVASFQGRKMLTGIARITRAASSHLSAEQPHFDALPEKYARLDAQLAANIYLQVPGAGGELEIWDVPPLHPMSQVPDDWRAMLPGSIKIRPQQGELIIFNCRRPHAVGEFTGTDRVTAQTFIGWQKEAGLQLWN